MGKSPKSPGDPPKPVAPTKPESEEVRQASDQERRRLYSQNGRLGTMLKNSPYAQNLYSGALKQKVGD